MTLFLWLLVLFAGFALAVCYAACAVAGMADEHSDNTNTARPGGHTSVAAAHDPVRGNAGRATPRFLRILQ